MDNHMEPTQTKQFIGRDICDMGAMIWQRFLLNMIAIA